MSLASTAEEVRALLDDASRGLVEREILLDLLALSLVSGEHLLVIGPPGTAKSEAVRRLSRGLEARYFEYLLGRFTEPSEIFGPIDLRKLREGVVETETRGMLPEAEVAFLDEVFLGSTAILNTLLALLNERTFRRGHTAVKVPLRLCVGASNALPEDESLAAFADRFLVRVFVEPVPDPGLEALLEAGWRATHEAPSRKASLSSIEQLSRAAQGCDLTAVRPELAQALRLLRKAGVMLSDRRAVKVQKLIAAAAALSGREAATGADLWPIVYAVPTAAAQAVAREALRELLSRAESSVLMAAAEDASAGPAARASRLARDGEALLSAGVADAAARLRVEGVLREIDAGFTAATMPSALSAVRARLVAALAPS